MQLEHLIPDFDEMQELSEECALHKRQIIILENTIESLEASYIKQALENREYWVEGKRPTITYCNSVVASIGNTEEQKVKLQTLREELANHVERYNALKNLIRIKRDQLELYRTESANRRKGFLD
jgi:uncharacterized protein (DUF342 family)